MQFINRAKHLNNKKRTHSRNHEAYEYDFDLMCDVRGLVEYCSNILSLSVVSAIFSTCLLLLVAEGWLFGWFINANNCIIITSCDIWLHVKSIYLIGIIEIYSNAHFNFWTKPFHFDNLMQFFPSIQKHHKRQNNIQRDNKREKTSH